MNPTWLTLSVAIVVAGKWSQGKGIDVPAIVALGLIALMMSVLSQVDERIANLMTILVLIVVTFIYGEDILKKVRLAK